MTSGREDNITNKFPGARGKLGLNLFVQFVGVNLLRNRSCVSV